VGIRQAVMMGDKESVQQHIEASSYLDEDEWTHGSSPLITGSAFGEIKSIRLLIKSGANFNIRNMDGSTALILASFYGYVDIVKSPLEKGANKDIQNVYSRSSESIYKTPVGQLKEVYSALEEGLKIKFDYKESKLLVILLLRC
jgi:ankyrin repeat protein